jgi:hypothetical protein
MPLDKIAHLLVGMVIGLLSGYLLPLWAGVVIATGVGAAKELYDYQHPESHNADWEDLLLTVTGAMLTTPFIWMFK